MTNFICFLSCLGAHTFIKFTMSVLMAMAVVIRCISWLISTFLLWTCFFFYCWMKWIGLGTNWGLALWLWHCFGYSGLFPTIHRLISIFEYDNAFSLYRAYVQWSSTSMTNFSWVLRFSCLLGECISIIVRRVFRLSRVWIPDLQFLWFRDHPQYYYYT